MGIEEGLSNQKFRLDLQCRRLDRDESLMLQNTVKSVRCESLDDPSENAAPSRFRRRLADCLSVHAAASDSKTAKNTGRIVLLRSCTWDPPVLRQLAMEKQELCKSFWHLES